MYQKTSLKTKSITLTKTPITTTSTDNIIYVNSILNFVVKPNPYFNFLLSKFQILLCSLSKVHFLRVMCYKYNCTCLSLLQDIQDFYSDVK